MLHTFDPFDASAATSGEKAEPSTPRTPTGRFTGAGSVALTCAPPAPVFIAPDTATRTLEAQLSRALDTLLGVGWTGTSGAPLPVAALQASPGAGKSRTVREHLAHQAGLQTDIVFHAPTLALAEEACAHARELGAEAHVFRGRSAMDPETRQPMCAKADLANEVGKLGLPVGPTLCRRVEKDGTERLCPLFQGCAYQRQRTRLPEIGVQRYLSTQYLTVPDPTGRAVGLRVIDETFWKTLIRNAQVPLEAFTAPWAGFPQPRRDPGKTATAGRHPDLLAAAQAVSRMLSDDIPLHALPYSADDLDAFGADEMAATPQDLEIRPDQKTTDQRAALKEAMVLQQARQFRRIWQILAEAKRQGRRRSERLILTRDAEGVRRIKIFGRIDLQADAPVLVLDADADPVILDAVFPGAQIETLSLRPNAHVIQVEDRRMSHGTLLGNDMTRDAWVAVIRAEVLRDRAGAGGGVLVGATRKVIQRLFEDAGHDFAGMSNAAVSDVMLNTRLHGAHWTWFGRSLGENRYRTCSAVVVIGREELPLEAVEDDARALFGDTPGEDLTFVTSDAQDRRLLPEEIVPYHMADGSARGASVRRHPDPRIAALQRQTRECATRQLVERLRLAHAAKPKRVVLGSSLPIPDLPVTDLVHFHDLVPSRSEQACAEAFLTTGALRLSAPGLHADAPETFRTVSAARSYLKRVPAAGWRAPRGGPGAVRVRLRQDIEKARSVEAIVAATTEKGARTIATAAYGPLAAFKVLRIA